MKDIEKVESSNIIIKGAALGKSADRAMQVKSNPSLYVKPILKQIEKNIKDGTLVNKETDRLDNQKNKIYAASEYIYLTRLQDYINERMDQIRGSFFETLNEREMEFSEDDPIWYEGAPKSNIPGEIRIEEEGVKFQRAGGAFDKNVIDMKALSKEHPVIYKNMFKKVVIPAVEEREVDVFDEEKFFEKAKGDKKLQKFITKKYKNPQFRVYDIFDE